jgi:hypothetical protein
MRRKRKKRDGEKRMRRNRKKREKRMRRNREVALNIECCKKMQSPRARLKVEARAPRLLHLSAPLGWYDRTEHLRAHLSHI